MLGLLMPASAWAAPFDAIPAGTLEVGNVLYGTSPGVIYDPNAPEPGNVTGGWCEIAIGDKVFDANKLKLMRMAGEITSLEGSIEGSWEGVWVAWGLVSMATIDGSAGYYDLYQSDPGLFANHASWAAGWAGASNMVCFTHDVPGNYDTGGPSLIMEDTRRGDSASPNPWSDIPNDQMTTDQIGFQMDWDMSNYAPADQTHLGTYHTTTWDPSQDPIVMNEVGFPQDPTAPISVGIRHSNIDLADPMAYDDFTDTVMYLSIVTDLSDHLGSVSFSELALDVVGKLPGDANLDGVVDDKDASIIAANWLTVGAGWQQGDFGGGGPDDWGGLDGIVNDVDAAIFAAHYGDFLTAEGAIAPEPGTLCLLLLGAMVLFGRKLAKR